ncbi:bile acid:sodium symporter family protein [Jeotgalibacillus sp. S-D1]|uniref:bile acid:sodium symporter family protein n=1 Tax=Jeotgalibacillus sp. S-D1 TaxID=2552189 RepID=UPI00105A94E4|nr:bile acid:sodium symporter family protein [Jeotgalibacillus sp. S-D1]TDL31452.1 bile acid:sodium symporter family protein [Jeotgalibacillus sp. S-D1]
MGQLTRVSRFAGKTFAFWVLLIGIIAFIIPESFTWISPYINSLLGVIMFGMGMTLTPQDFKAVARQPKSVLVGVAAQFTVMPLIAFGLAKLFQLPPELAVGVILVGCCPGGTASNVITYLAKGNTALSVAVTSVSTLLAPVLTPALIFVFASQWLNVSFTSMFISVLQVVLVPVVLGIAVRSLLKEKVEQAIPVMPLVSVVAIVAIVGAVVGGNKEQIISTGLLVFSIVILHNGLGLLIGFLLAKGMKLDLSSQKAVSIEVGMQNSGLGAALAIAHFNPAAAVPSAIFSLWHNVSGPILATIWNRKSK